MSALSNVVKGCLSNGIAGALLYLISTRLQLEKYFVVALAMQYAVFLVHGLPCRSERFYDLTGA